MYTLQISIKKRSGFERKLVTSFLILGNSSSDAAVKSGGGSMGEDAAMGLDRLSLCRGEGFQPALQCSFPHVFHGKSWHFPGITRYQFRCDLPDPSHLERDYSGCGGARDLEMKVLVLCLFTYRFLV